MACVADTANQSFCATALKVCRDTPAIQFEDKIKHLWGADAPRKARLAWSTIQPAKRHVLLVIAFLNVGPPVLLVLGIVEIFS